MIFAAILLVLMVMAPAASADSVTWALNDLIFTDGATATGSFGYDAATNTVSFIHVVTSAGALFTGTTYTAVDPGFGPFAFDLAFVATPGLPDYTGKSVLELEFFTSTAETTLESLTNSGGIVLAELNELVCANAACSTVNADIRGTVPGGTVVGVVSTPEASTGLLLGMGLISLLGVVARRRVLNSQVV